jgi:hypothetical protein
MRAKFIQALSATCVGAGLLAASPNAFASDYALYWNPTVASGPADEGAIAEQIVYTLNSGCNDFVDHEMWYGVVSGGNYWVEVGITSGQTISGCLGGAVFWADNRNGGGYNEHEPGIQWYTGSPYDLAVTENGSGSCSWTVWWGGNGWQNVGTSTNNCPGSGRYLVSGIETTSTASSQQVSGETWGWQMESNNGTWQNNWPTMSLVQYTPPYIRWIDSNTTTEEVLNESF